MAESGASTRKLKMADIHAAAERLKNWGRWGADDEIGTLNYTRPEDIVAATRLVQKGKVISLALPYDQHGPQGGKIEISGHGAVQSDSLDAAHRHGCLFGRARQP